VSSRGRPSKPILSRRGIAERALALVDAEGLEALTTRRLARELGVEGPSLYNHVRGRDDLIDAITELIAEDIDFEPLEGGEPARSLRGFARSYRAAFAAHPNIIGTIVQRPVNTALALAAYDRLYAALTGWGWEPLEAGRLMAAIDFVVLGSAIEPFRGGFVRPPEHYAAEHPHLAAGLRAAAGHDIDRDGFELALDALLAQVDSRTTTDGLRVRGS
jgi:AcrR family transcriptional regulator